MPNRATVWTSCIGMEQTRIQTHHIKANWGSEQASKQNRNNSNKQQSSLPHMLQIHQKFECKWSVCSTQLNSTRPNQTKPELNIMQSRIQFKIIDRFLLPFIIALVSHGTNTNMQCTRSDNGSLPKMMLTTSMKIAAQHSETNAEPFRCKCTKCTHTLFY